MGNNSDYTLMKDSEVVESVLNGMGVTNITPQIVQSIIHAYNTYRQKTDSISLEETAKSIGACLKLKK